MINSRFNSVVEHVRSFGPMSSLPSGYVKVCARTFVHASRYSLTFAIDSIIRAIIFTRIIHSLSYDPNEALSRACKYGSPLLAKLAINKGAVSRSHKSLLDEVIEAVKQGNCRESAAADVLSVLLESGNSLFPANLDPKPNALLNALRLELTKIVQVLINAGVDVNGVETVFGKAPLHEVFRFLETDEGICKPEGLAVIEALSRHGANIHLVDEEGNSPYTLAMSIEKPEERIKAFRALYSGMPETLEIFEIAIDPNAVTKMLGSKDVLMGCKKAIVEALLDVDARDDSGNTALHTVCSLLIIDDEIIADLLDRGASTSIMNVKKETPLAMASAALTMRLASESESTMRSVLEKIFSAISHMLNENVQPLCSRRNSALHRAAKSGRWERVSSLINSHHCRRITNAAGRTPLQEAQQALKEVHKNMQLEELSKEIQIWDLEKTLALFDVNIVLDNEGNTFLHRSAEGGDVESVRDLLKRGATNHIINNARKSPCGLAFAKRDALREAKVKDHTEGLDEMISNLNKVILLL
ncbi:MAG: hypothetical protein KR126chlam1_00086 [Chlamydiae bacterium]|nr:hypothetical protein [Chlamydiota bacterium]